jgi:hypothetical protein
MKRKIIFVFSICFSNILWGQKIQQDNLDIFVDYDFAVTFEEHTLILSEKGKRILDYAAELSNDSTLLNNY